MEVNALAQKRFDSLIANGTPEPEATRAAHREIQHAGWYQVGSEWRKIGEDLREKINTRVAELQPDGTYMVPDVDVFYPNAVKGADDAARFDADDVQAAIVNTNSGINNGGQKPGLILEHPNDMDKLMGRPKPAFGQAINIRQSPREGMVRCDLVSVSPEIIQDWKKHRYTGLSAGFVSDDAGLGLRVGHIALLGGESQALMHLPMTEVYASSNVFFSTQPIPAGKANKMPEDMKKKMEAHQQMAAAYAAQMAGEPGHEEKFSQARSNYASCYGVNGEKDGEKDGEQFQNAGQKAMWAKVDAAGGKRTKDGKYDDEDMQSMWSADNDNKENKDGAFMAPLTTGTISYLGDAEQTGTTAAPEKLLQPFHNFAAKSPELKDAVNGLSALITGLLGKTKNLEVNFAAERKANAELGKKIRYQQFDAFITKKAAEGHQINRNYAAKVWGKDEGLAVDYVNSTTKVEPTSGESSLTQFVTGPDASRPVNFSASEVNKKAEAAVAAAMAGGPSFSVDKVQAALFGSAR